MFVFTVSVNKACLKEASIGICESLTDSWKWGGCRCVIKEAVENKQVQVCQQQRYVLKHQHNQLPVCRLAMAIILCGCIMSLMPKVYTFTV